MEKRFPWVLLLSMFMLLAVFSTSALAFDVSGTVSYGGSKNGRIYLVINTQNGTLGTSIASAGPYTIHGVPDGTTGAVNAFVDSHDTGSLHASDPFGSTSVAMAGGSLTGVNITLTDPSQPPAAAPPTFSVFPGPGSLLVIWDDNHNSTAAIPADSYTVYWSTDATPGPNDQTGGGHLTVTAGSKSNAVVISGLTDTTNLHVAVTATVGNTESTPSTAVPVTVGAPAQGVNITGTLTLPNAPITGEKVYVAVCNDNKIGPPSSCFLSVVNGPLGSASIPFTVSGVAAGTYKMHGVYDKSGTGKIDANGNLQTDDNATAPFTVSSSSVSVGTMLLDGANAHSYVRTSHYKDAYSEGYGVNIDVRSGAKRPVKVSLTAAPSASGLVPPIDLGVRDGGDFSTWLSTMGSAPQVNDSYSFDVTYNDNSTESLAGKVTAIAPLATPVSPSGPSTYSATPTFTWTAPSASPAGGFSYQIRLQNGMSDLWDSRYLASTGSLSAVYNFDGSALGTLSNNGSYRWYIEVVDAQGNSSANGMDFTFGTPLTLSTMSLPNATQGSSYSKQLQASGGTTPYSWSYTGTLPPGISLVNGVLSGTPSASGDFPFQVTVSDASVPANVASSNYHLFVASPTSSQPLQITTTSPLPAGAVNTNYMIYLAAQGGNPSYTFAVDANSTLPAGLTLDPGNGRISGTPTAAGSYSFTVKVTDSLSHTAAATLSLNVTQGTNTGSYNFRGRLTDSASPANFISGASVATVGLPSSVTATTDPVGYFTLTGIPANTTFQIHVSQPGYVDTYSANFTLTGNLDVADRPYTLFTPANVQSWDGAAGIALVSGTGIIRSKVVDKADLVNGFVGGAVVTATDSANNANYPVVYYDGSSYSTTATSASTGNYMVLNVPAGATVQVTAAKSGYSFESKTFVVTANSVSQGRISGSPNTATGTVYFTGSVTDNSTSTSVPLAGATVGQVGTSNGTTTLTDGSFVLTGLPLGAPFDLKVSKQGFIDSYITDQYLTTGVAAAGRPIGMFPTSQLASWNVTSGNGAIRGRVVDSANPATGYIGGVTLTAVDSANSGTTFPVTYWDSNGANVNATSTSNGSFAVYNVPAGTKVNVTATSSAWSFPLKTFTIYANSVSQGRLMGIASTTSPGLVNGSCGSANGQSFSTPPTTNLCSAGTAGPVNGNGSWYWSCQGAGGGSNASCSATVMGGGGSGPTSIGGRVRDVNSLGLGGINVEAFDSLGNSVSKTSTNMDGSYFLGVPPGSYKVHFDGTTQGYLSQWYQNATEMASATAVTVSSGTPVTAIDATLALAPPRSVSGTVSYSGNAHGRIYLTIGTNNGNLGTSIDGAGNFTIRGVPAGSYTVNAFMDLTGTATATQGSPTGSSTTVQVNTADVTGVTVTLADPTSVNLVAPQHIRVFPGSGAALIGWDSARDSGVAAAENYDVYWSTSSQVGPANFQGKLTSVSTNSDTPAILTGLTDGSSYYFVVVPRSGNTTGTPSAAVGPVTIGAGTGGNTVSGTVDFGAVTATGPLYVAVVDTGSKGETIYFTQVTSPVSPAAFSVSGVPNGSYNVYAILDQNQDHLIGLGDIMTSDATAPVVNLTGSGATGVTVKMGQPVSVYVNSYHSQYAGSTGTGPNDWYSVNYGVRGQTKQPVTVTLTSAPNLAGPRDLGVDGKEFHGWTGGNGAAPKVGDTYTFDVVYSDGTKETLSSSISALLSSFPTNLQVVGGSTIPSFTWTAPANAPAQYRYELQVYLQTNNGGSGLWDVTLPATQTSAVYGGAALQVGTTYYVNLSVKDFDGNTAAVQGISFKPTVASTSLPSTMATPAGGTYNKSLNVTLKNSATDAVIYYTTDGSTPTTNSAVYSAPIAVSASTVLKFFGVNGAGQEMVKTERYVIDTVVPVTAAAPAGGQYATPPTVTLTSSKPALIYYTLDGNTPTTASAVYMKPLVIGSSATLTFFAKDAAGNVETPHSESYVINTNGPVTSATPAGGTYNSSQTVTLVNSVNGAVIYYTLDGSMPTTSSTVYRAPILLNGNTVLKFFSKDPATGTKEPLQTQTYIIDSVLPETKAAPTGGIYNNAQVVTLSLNKKGTIYYTIDGSTPTLLSPVYSAPIPVNATTTIKFFAKDAAGNQEAVKSQSYTIDTIAPVTTATPPGGLYNATQSVVLAASEDATIYYTTDGTTPNMKSSIYTAPISVDKNMIVRYFAVDLAGNLESVKSQSYAIDTVVPTTSATPDGGMFNKALSVSLQASKAGVTIYYTTDGSTPTTASPVYSAPIQVAASLTLNFFAKDVAGNVENVKSRSFVIDTVSPFTMATPPGGLYGATQNVALSSSTGANPTIYYTTNPDAALDAFTIYSGPIPVSSSTVLRYYSRTASGNVETVKSQTYVIDSVLPVTTAFPAAGSYNAAQSVTLTVSKAATIYYTTDGSTPTTLSSVYSGPIPVSATLKLKFFARDLTGNNEAVKTLAYTIDTVAPVTTPAQAGGLFTDGFALALTASKPATIYYTTDGTAPTTDSPVYSAPIVLHTTPDVKTVVVKFFAKDAVGNQEEVKSQSFTLLDIALVQRTLELAVGNLDPTETDLKLLDVAPLVNEKPAPNGIIDTGDLVVLMRRLVGIETW